MARKPESRLQLRIQKAIRAQWPNAYVRKIHGSEFMAGGMADLLICIEGFFFMVEVKMPGEEASELQIADGMEVKRANGIWFVTDNVDHCISTTKDAIERKLDQFYGVDRKTKTRAKTRR